MRRLRSRTRVATWLGAIAAACLPAAAMADETAGKVVWIDQKNASLLLECPDKGCAQIPNAKPGETYSFVVPEKLRDRVYALKEGESVKLVYDDAKEKGYVISAVEK